MIRQAKALGIGRWLAGDFQSLNCKSQTSIFLIQALALMLVFAAVAGGQTKTTVQDTLYSPSGTALSGTITISNNATFAAADGTVVPKSTIARVTVTNGVFSVDLIPNAGSTPSGSSYNAVYKLGQAYLSETWVVPASATAVDLSAVRVSSPPAALAAGTQLPDIISTSALLDKGGQVFNVKSYGALGDGATDDTAAINAAINAAAASGGTVFFSQGIYLIAGALTFPNSGGANPRQMPLRLTGAGSDSQSTGTYPAGVYGSVLNLTYASGAAKFNTTGIGTLEIDHLTLEDAGGDSVPFVATTNTALHIHNCSFLGSKTGIAADQDAIVLGTATVNFQGYGTAILDNFFDYIRRAVYLRRGSNAVYVLRNSIWLHSGSNLAGGAAVEIDGTGDQASGNSISDNLFEMGGYVYGIKLTAASANEMTGNSFWDPGVGALGIFYLDAASGYNTLSCNQTSGTLCEAGSPPATNTLLATASSATGNRFGKAVFVMPPASAVLNGNTSEIWSGLADYPVLVLHGDKTNVDPQQLNIKGGSDPNQEVKIGYNTASNYGSIEAIHTGVALVPLNLQPQGGKVGIATINPQAQLDVAGDVRADSYAFHNGISWTSGTGVPSGAPGNGSLYSRSDGGSGTSVYSYEAGGWAPLGSGGGGMVYPGAGMAVSTGSAWATSLTAPSGSVVGTTDTQTLTNKTVDGASPATMGYLDATSSIQTQLNGKLSSSPANVTTTVGTTAIASNTCATTTTVTMTGLTSTMTLSFTPNADVSGVTGWGSTGGLTIIAWPAANTVNYDVCNQTAASITPSASVTFNVSAR